MYPTHVILFLTLLVRTCQPDTTAQPLIFEANNITTDQIEYGITFSPDGEQLYFTRSDGEWGKNNSTHSYIYHARKEGDHWSMPRVAPFSGQYRDSDPHWTPDGKRLYFISDRPRPDGSTSGGDIWVQELAALGAPLLVDEVNSPATEFSPKTTRSGDLYFASDRKGGMGQGDLYVAKRKGNGFEIPVNLGPIINASTGEWNLEIDPSGRILIFEASGRPENLSPYGDLYISFREKGTFTRPQPLSAVNTPGSDLSPCLSGDGQLYFSSTLAMENTFCNIYFISFDNGR